MTPIDQCIRYIKEVCLEHNWAYFPVAVLALLAVWLGVPYLILLSLATLFIADFVTGIAASLYEGKVITSGWNGLGRSILKAIGYCSLIWMVWAVGNIFAHYFGLTLDMQRWLVIIAVGMSSVNEAWSIKENIERMGIDLSLFAAWLTQLRNKVK